MRGQAEGKHSRTKRDLRSFKWIGFRFKVPRCGSGTYLDWKYFNYHCLTRKFWRLPTWGSYTGLTRKHGVALTPMLSIGMPFLYLELAETVTEPWQCFYRKCLIRSLIRWHITRNKRLESFDKRSFQLRLAVCLFTTEHILWSAPKCKVAGVLQLSVNQWIFETVFEIMFFPVCCQRMIYQLCVGETRSIFPSQFRQSRGLRLQSTNKQHLIVFLKVVHQPHNRAL